MVENIRKLSAKSFNGRIGAGLCMYDIVVKKFTFAMSSPDEFLCNSAAEFILSPEMLGENSYLL